MRLDKYLCDMNIGTRKEIKEYIKKGFVKVDGVTVKKADMQVTENSSQVLFQGKEVAYQMYFYYLLNKPSGYITATEDKHDKTVMDLIPKELMRTDLFPVGRLDKDTTGLLLITNDGELSHRLLSAKYHVWKTYEVTLAMDIDEAQTKALESGIDLGEDGVTLPAKCAIIKNCPRLLHLSIREGKYHQVKRMLKAVGNEVIGLKRITFGELSIPSDLKEGMVKELTLEEVELLRLAVKGN